MKIKTRILVVDDNSDLCENIKEVLEGRDYFAESAVNGKEAIELARNNKYDIVLIDIKLPDISGNEVVEKIAEISPSTDFIYMTGHASINSAIEAVKQEHVVSYEIKPLDINHLLALINQVTERKKAEEEMRKTTTLLKNVINSTPDLIFVKDLKLRTIMCNKAYANAVGKKPEEMIGNTDIENGWNPELVYGNLEKGICGFENDDRQALEGVEVHNSFDPANVGNEIRFFDTRKLPLRDAKGRIFGLLGVAHDITERIKAEEQLRKLSQAIEQSPVTVMITDKKGSVEYANLKFVQLTGYSIEEVIGQTPSILKSGKTSPEVYKELWKTILSGKEWRGEFCNRKKTGENYWESAVISPLKNPEGVITHFIAVKEDITERKKMEEALLQSEKLKSIGTITAGISHEFNNLLAIISGNVQLLEESLKDDEELMDTLRTIKRAANDGAEISSKMLKFTKTANDTAGLVPFDINELINQAIDFTMPRWKNMAQVKGINYHMDTEGKKSVPSILCNPTELREVFVNIINNALDTMPDDGRITFRTWSGEDTVFISISDTGEGMSEEVKKNIFDPFFTTRTPVGTGLGLSTAYGITTRHGGNIEVESAVGQGSTFTLQFPSAAKADSPEESPEPKQDIKSKSLRILVVDDEEEICKILDNFLSKKGHLVRTVDSGREAIILTKAADYDLVLCDLVMPDVFGYDVIKALNKLEKRPKIGIMTGWGEKLKSIDEEGLKVDFIIKKPFDFSVLTGHINDLGI
ncbi:MAG: response regulator [Candidatus Scalindua sp.]